MYFELTYPRAGASTSLFRCKNLQIIMSSCGTEHWNEYGCTYGFDVTEPIFEEETFFASSSTEALMNYLRNKMWLCESELRSKTEFSFLKNWSEEDVEIFIRDVKIVLLEEEVFKIKCYIYHLCNGKNPFPTQFHLVDGKPRPKHPK